MDWLSDALFLTNSVTRMALDVTWTEPFSIQPCLPVLLSTAALDSKG